MCSEFDIPQKSVLLTTLPNLNDKKKSANIWNKASKLCKKQPLSLLPNAVGVPVEFAETPPPTKCHLSIKVTTSTRNMDAMSESFLLLTQLLAQQLTQLTVDCSSSSVLNVFIPLQQQGRVYANH